MIWVVGHAVMPVLGALRTISATVMSPASSSPIVQLFRLAILKQFMIFPPQRLRFVFLSICFYLHVHSRCSSAYQSAKHQISIFNVPVSLVRR